MSGYDRYADARHGARLARSGVAVDQGLRAYMIGVYNYMALGLGVTGLVAWGAFQLGKVQSETGRLDADRFRWDDLYVAAALGDRPRRSLALVFWLSARIGPMSWRPPATPFIAFATLIGLSMSALLLVCTGASFGRASSPQRRPSRASASTAIRPSAASSAMG